jgi:small subunit ribosomal protein S18
MRRYKNDVNLYFDYREVKTLQRYLDMDGRSEPGAKTGLSAKQQRQLATAVKRARHLALLPFVSSN